MKRQVINYIAIAFLGVLQSCELSQDTEGISRITNYPIITLKGEQWNTIPVGGSFTDPGVTATEGDTPIEVVTTGTVNTAVAGVYTIQYVAVNKDDYSATEYRYVGVISPSVVGTNMTGSYKRNAGAFGVSTITKISDNFYYSDNVGGVAVPDPSLGVYFYHFDTGKLGVPFQNTPGNAFACTNATVNLGVSYTWTVINSGYGAAPRTFEKQP